MESGRASRALAVVLGVGGTGAVCRYGGLDWGLNPFGDVPPPSGTEDFEGRGVGEVRIPDGFAVETVASGLEYLTDLAFMPDAPRSSPRRTGWFASFATGSWSYGRSSTFVQP